MVNTSPPSIVAAARAWVRRAAIFSVRVAAGMNRVCPGSRLASRTIFDKSTERGSRCASWLRVAVLCAAAPGREQPNRDPLHRARPREALAVGRRARLLYQRAQDLARLLTPEDRQPRGAVGIHGPSRAWTSGAVHVAPGARRAVLPRPCGMLVDLGELGPRALAYGIARTPDPDAGDGGVREVDGAEARHARTMRAHFVRVKDYFAGRTIHDIVVACRPSRRGAVPRVARYPDTLLAHPAGVKNYLTSPN